MRSWSRVCLAIAIFSCAAAYADEPPQLITLLVGQASEPMTKTPVLDEAARAFVDVNGNVLIGKAPTKTNLDLKLDAPVRVLNVAGLPATPKVVQGQAEPLALTFSDADNVDVGVDYVLESSKPTVAKIEDHLVRGVLSGTVASDTADIRVKIGGFTVGTVKYTVVEAIKSLTVAKPLLEVAEGGRPVDPGVKMIGKNSGKAYSVPERTLEIEQNEFVELTAEGMLRAKELPQFSGTTVPAEIVYDSPDLLDKSKRERQKVTISLRAGSIDFSPSSAILPAFGEKDFLAVLRSRDGRVKPATFNWTVPTDAQKWVAVAQSADHVTVLWNSPTTKNMPLIVNIMATATPQDGGAPVTATLPIRLAGEVVAFEPINVQLTILDDRTVSDLYGSRTALEYYATRIRFNNNIQDKDGEKKATSILAFSDSIEVGVTLQKRLTKEAWKVVKRDHPDAKNDWVSVLEKELFAFIEPRALDQKDMVSVFPNRRVRYDADHPNERLPEMPVCTGGLTYRPHTFEMMVNSVDARSDRSKRTIAFTTLATLGVAASFVTSISPPTGGSVLNATDKFSNLLVPSLAKLFPSLKETQRQNIVAHTMRPIEEIPYGSDLSRIIFFPKRTFTGMIPDYEVRIASICPFLFKVQVALLNKGDLKTLGANAAPQ